MKLLILLPSRVFFESDVDSVSAEGADGSFCLLPRHVDFVSALVPGILSYRKNGNEVFFAVGEGILVKSGSQVTVSARKAVGGLQLGELRSTVEEEFARLDEHEKRIRSSTAKIEAGFIRRFLEVQKYG